MKFLYAAFILIVFFCEPAARAASGDPPQMSGTVVDTSGAVIAGATVQVRSAKGAVRITAKSDANGSFTIGLTAGTYRLVISNPGFESKEIPVTIGTAEASAPLRISLAVGSEMTTINVEGRADSLIGIAESATQGTVGSTEIQDRRFFARGKFWRGFPASSSRNMLGVEKQTNIFSVASILITEQTSLSSLTECRSICLRTRTAKGMPT